MRYKDLFEGMFKTANLLVQLSIFLIDLFVGTCRLSIHARLEAFVIQTKLKLKTLHAFAPLSSEFTPFLACHHSITDFEINAFLNQDSYILIKFVSDLVLIFDTG
jgi:hypothetical protein